MSSVLDLLKPAPPIEEIRDQAQVHRKYRYWRFRIFYSMYIGYIFYYFTRKSFTFVMSPLMDSLGYNASQLGFLGTVLAITYGMSKFTSGILADRSNPRYFMSIGLILTGVLNILFGLSSSLTFFAIFWGLNGWFQGWGWPGCARLLTHWYSQKERGTWWGVWNTSHNVGGAVIPLVAAWCAARWGWRAGMYVPGALCIVVGLFLINRLRDTPQSLGLPVIEKFKNDYSTIDQDSQERELSAKEILVNCVLKNKYIWLLAVSYFFVYVVRQAVNDWSVLFLVKEKGYQPIQAALSVCSFEVGGFFGSLLAGWTSDRVFRGRRGPINILFMAGAVCSVMLLFYVPAGRFFLDSTMLFATGFFIFGPQMLIGVSAAELSHKKAAATATGFAGSFAYLGAATAGYPLGRVIHEGGWYHYFLILGLCSVMATLLLLPTWKLRNSQLKVVK